MAMSPALLNDTFRYYLTVSAVSFARPTAWEISLHTEYPGTDGSVGEVTDAAYVRQPVTMAIDVTDPDAPFASNSATVSFPAAVAEYEVTYVVLWGDGTTPLDIQRLRDSRVIPIGEQATFAAGEYKIGGV